MHTSANKASINTSIDTKMTVIHKIIPVFVGLAIILHWTFRRLHRGPMFTFSLTIVLYWSEFPFQDQIPLRLITIG
ncbi:MAG: hypothetical protein ACI8XG_001728 [Congregibacter sp.]|jgi:hypothetical protein